MVIHAESFHIDQGSGATLQTRIKQRIVEGVLTGRFRPGERMPSSRVLARHLGVSRITVTLAYTDLVADDYLVARGRSGYFVSQNAPRAPAFELGAGQPGDRPDWARHLAHRPQAFVDIERPENWQDSPYPFVYGQTDPALFDLRNWRQCALRAMGQKEFDALTADHYERDDPMLIEYLRRQILPRRGIVAAPENILVTMGAQNAIWLCAQLLMTQRRVAAVENPGYPGLRQILDQTRCRKVSVPVDAQGLRTDALPAELDVLFATVSHQCPTNATMPMSRRRELLRLARTRDFLIVEDDYEFEMAFQTPSSPALKALDESGNVIYVGSFSKSLFPGLRLGYLVAPAVFVEEARKLRTTVLRHPPGHIQRTAAYFLSLGHYDAQINRMRKAYQRRREAMLAALRAHGLLPAGSNEAGGSSFWLELGRGLDTNDLARRLHARGVVIEPGHAFFDPAAPRTNFLRLAYSSIATARIGEGIRILADEIAKSGTKQ